MILVEESVLILTSIEQLVGQFSDEDYSKPLDILNQNSLSQHVRHILEFYQEFILGLQRGQIDFDVRNRSQRLEVDKDFALDFISFLKRELELVELDGPIPIRVSTHEKDVRPILESSTFRELAYCNEHSVHHMAIIKIALKINFPFASIREGFGVAFSTQHVNNLTVSC